MADCGATGSALDRAARAVLSSDSSKHWGQWLGHAAATVGGTSSRMMPVATPEFLVMPTTRVNGLMDVQPSALLVQQQQQHQQHQHLPPSILVGPTLHQPPSLLLHSTVPLHHHHPHAMHSIHHHHHHHHEFEMRRQMEAMYLQQQQMNHVLMQQSISSARRTTTEQQVPVEQVAAEPSGHEGLVQGATIEELAAAWAEAEAEYQELEQAVNLAAATTTTTAATQQSYEFGHTDKPAVRVDWMEEGQRQFDAGNLKEAIRAFEMELQFGDVDNATAWMMLGHCHAENDQDREAIVCLEQAVDRDPYSSEARLALGVSYVNELNHNRALDHLKAWITHNPKFAGIEVGDDVYGSGEITGTVESAFDEVQRLLLRAFEAEPSADVLEALGVVYNVSRDYEAAIDSFRKAIDLKPDYQLYNRLGATLANCNQSDKALPAYRRALEIKPKYARAWLNMAISHSNLQNYEEAARCYLQTLSLNPSAIHCWSYLRIALSCAEMWDLIPNAAAMDIESFREHFDFVMYNG